jgi:hypothetical protein
MMVHCRPATHLEGVGTLPVSLEPKCGLDSKPYSNLGLCRAKNNLAASSPSRWVSGLDLSIITIWALGGRALLLFVLTVQNLCVFPCYSVISRFSFGPKSVGNKKSVLNSFQRRFLLIFILFSWRFPEMRFSCVGGVNVGIVHIYGTGRL